MDETRLPGNGEPEIAPAQPYRVMLVDDQPMVAEALYRILATEADMEFHYCDDPAQALQSAEQIRPDIILLDLVMPDIDGMTVLHGLRVNPLTRDIPVVVLSGEEDVQMKAAVFAAGGNDYLIKWPDRIELLARIRYYSQWFINLQQRDEAFRALQDSQRELKQSHVKLEEAYQQLQSLQGQLLQSDKMASIGQLAAGVAHEINNPIGFVYSNIGTLDRYVEDVFGLLEAYERMEGSVTDGSALAEIRAQKARIDLDFLKDDTRDLMRECRDGITRVKKIVQDLKDFSHLDAGDDFQWADLHAGLDSTLNIVSNELKYKAEIVKEYGALPEIECLPSQLNQVFLNMLVNAGHAIESRGVITIRTGLDEEGSGVWVEFADTGKGIAANHLERIFDPFFTTKPVGKGTGLGLSLSYGIVQKHGGHVAVASEVGKGTTFRIWLPVRQPSKPDEALA